MATTGSGTSSPATGVGGSYTLGAIVTRMRSWLDDTTEEYLWSDQEITEYIDYIQKQLCAEMPIILDKATAAVCEVSFAQGDGTISLHDKITAIVRAKVNGGDRYLTIASAAEMDILYTDWDESSVTEDTPSILVHEGIGPSQAYIYPPADVSGTLKLVVYRLPLNDLDYTAHSADALEIDKYVHLITHGVLAQAYLKQDADTENQKKAEYHRVLWEGQNGHGGDKEKIRRMVKNQYDRPAAALPRMAFL